MGSAKHSAPKGTFDILPGQEPARARVLERTAQVLSSAGYGRIETPAFEDTELFARGVGGSTDIVQKEMFSFTDRGDRALTLRPEGTAPVCRSYVENGMHRLPQPVKLWYSGPFFRAEAPQAGRYRQFNQIGAEAIGSDSPLLDAELIILLDDILRGLGVGGLRLGLSSLGSKESRTAYFEELRAYLRAHEPELSEEVRGRIDTNPMRAFDADHEGTRGVMAEAPRMLDHLDEADAAHFAEVRAALDDAGVAYELDGTLVRGLDYYTRTVFEYSCDRLGAQSGVGGGGRYDGLVELVGGPATPAIGWAAGIERILLALDHPDSPPAVDAFVVAAEDDRRSQAFALVLELRRGGLAADLDLAERSFKGQMKQANRSGARAALIFEVDGSLTLREMDSGDQRTVDPAEAASQVAAVRDSAIA